ncbi:histidine kinase [Caballeronia catudaia]|uniref:Histidine kinase n=1 Tax=Caballeronia catudaia TaxID=1777136 RepID=A0A158AR38_9BURK|nr:histidine kinase [Caballeronia catudaia]
MPNDLRRAAAQFMPASVPEDDADMFDLAPVYLWLEDFSAVREQFERWRAAGVADLRAFLAENPERVAECSSRIRVVTVNRRTLSLFHAKDVDHLVQHLDRVFRDDMLATHVDELEQLWSGKTRFVSQTVNYTLEGKRLDVLLKAVILPGHEASWEPRARRESAHAAHVRRAGVAVIDSIRQLLEVNKVNSQFYSGMPLSFAMGAATAHEGERLEPMLQRADAAMYAEKRAHYNGTSA